MANEFIQKDYGGGAVATTLNGAISGSAASIVVTSGTSYPDGSAGPFVICIARGTGTEEKVIITSRAGNTLTVLGGAAGRGYDGSTGQAQVNAATVEHVMDAYSIKQANTFINTPTTRGDIVFRNASGNPQRLGVGAAGTVLKGGTDPSYAAIVDADVSASASIALTKLAVPGLTGRIILTDGSTVPQWVAPTGDATISAVGVVTVGAGSRSDGDALGIYGGVPTWNAGYTTGTEGLRPTGREGMLYWATDTNRLWVHDGTNWIIVAEPWQSYTPTLSNATLGNGTLTASYRRSDGTCEVVGIFTLGSTSTVTGNLGVSVPTGTDAALANEPLISSYGQITDASGGGVAGIWPVWHALGTVARMDSYTWNATAAGAASIVNTAAASPVSVAWAVNDIYRFGFRWKMASRYS